MTAKKTDDTATQLATTEIEKQQNCAPAVTAPAPPVATAEPPKPPKRSTTTIRAACSNAKYGEAVREVFVNSLVHLFGTESGRLYLLDKYFGTEAGLAIILSDYVEKKLNCRRYEDRITALLPSKLKLEPVEMEVTQQVNLDRHSVKIPQIKRAVGLSNYQEAIAIIFELRALAAVTTKAAILEAEELALKRDKELVYAVEHWNPMKKLTKPDVTHPLAYTYTDEQGDQIIYARLRLARQVEVVRQLGRLKAHLKTLRGKHAWIVSILKDCRIITQKRMAAQLARDLIGEAKFARGMIQAGYETDFHGKPYADYLTDNGDKTK